jgi:ATP-dependent helicase/nuclease subunit B
MHSANSLTSILLPVSACFWQNAAHVFTKTVRDTEFSPDEMAMAINDFSGIRVVVPTFEHAHLFLNALSAEMEREYIPPQIHTMFAWLGMQQPLGAGVAAGSERLMSLYAELRQHAWLKTLFGAKRNTDLLPLAQTLLALSDELTEAWLPTALQAPERISMAWHEALAQLALPVQKLVSDETQLVWTLWQSQLERKDRLIQEFQQKKQIAATASSPLVWISPTMPNPMEAAFLDAYQKRCQVVNISIDWRAASVDTRLIQAWPDLAMPEGGIDGSGMQDLNAHEDARMGMAMNSKNINAHSLIWSNIRICAAKSLEDEAEQAAQTVVEWLQQGKQSIAVIAQDRVVSRRLRALLERAEIFVADETGWKLSTTRAAAALVAWFEVLSSRADTIALLDFLKSPFLTFLDISGEKKDDEVVIDKADIVMDIELALRKSNVLGGWEAVLSALEALPQARMWLVKIARLAHNYNGNSASSRRSLKEWTAVSLQTLAELNMQASLQEDRAGFQLVQMLQALNTDCQFLDTSFSFSEWRAFINMQMEATPFILPQIDQRVVMLPLNGARLRNFDAVYVIGADAKHLPSKAQETLFFSNAVRRECGLVTREQRQQQQLRDFAELLLSNAVVVMSWQAEVNGEHNSVSPWIAQLELMLARQKLPPLISKKMLLPERRLQRQVSMQSKASAATLMPTSLSASGLTSLIACPYQFFAGRMLRLTAMDVLSDQPEKRDYGDWLHTILKTYHDKVKAEQISIGPEREKLLEDVSETLFLRVLKQSPAALGYSVRWRKVIPAYILWANARETEGWQFEVGEAWAEQTLAWDGGAIQLRGRIDRIDQRVNADGTTEHAVLDYKTKNTGALRARLKDFDDHQLPFYGLLAPDLTEQASYVALEVDREKIGDVEASDFIVWKRELEQAIRRNMQAIQQGAAMPAQGVETTCQYCDMRGLCRKGAW